MTTLATIGLSIAALLGVDPDATSTKATPALAQSYQYEKDKDYPKAIAVLKKSDKAAADPYLLKLRLGWLHYLNGQFDDAERHYRAAIAADPKSVEARLGCLLPMLAAGKCKEAETLAREIVREDPRNYYANLRLAVALRLQERFAEALDIAQKMLVTYPADGHFRRELVIASAAQTAGLPNSSPSAKDDAKIEQAVNLSNRLEKAKKYSDAIRALDDQYAAHPKNYVLNLRLGWLCYLAGDYRRSADCYYAAVQASPQSSEAGNGYLLPLLAQARYDDAESFARQITKGDPGNYYANLRLAVALRLQEKYDEAEKVLRPMLDAYPRDVYFMTEMGLLDAARDKRDAAKKTFSHVLTLDPENATAKNQLGLLR